MAGVAVDGVLVVCVDVVVFFNCRVNVVELVMARETSCVLFLLYSCGRKPDK